MIVSGKNELGNALLLTIAFISLAQITAADKPLSFLERIITSMPEKEQAHRLRLSAAELENHVAPQGSDVVSIEETEAEHLIYEEESYERFLQIANQSFSMPSNAPTSAAGECNVDITVTCRTDNEEPIMCGAIERPDQQCMDNARVMLTYEKSPCNEANNDQDEPTYNCKDSRCAESEAVQITCVNKETVLCNCTVKEGGIVDLSSTSILPNDGIVCTVSNPDNGEVCQEFNFDASGDSDIKLKDEFGSLSVESCTNNNGVGQNCLVDVLYSYTITNSGTFDYMIEEVIRTTNGEDPLNIGIDPQLLGPGFVGAVSEVAKIDACRLTETETTATMMGTSNGQVCNKSDQLVIPAPGTSTPTPTPPFPPAPPAPTMPPLTPAPSPPSSTPVTSPPTFTPVTPLPTSAPVTSSPIFAPVTSSPTFAPVTSSPIFAPVTSSPTFAPVTSSPTFAPVTSSPTFAPVTSSPTFSPPSSPTFSPVTPVPTSAPTAAPVTPVPTSAPTATPCEIDAKVKCWLGNESGGLKDCEDVERPNQQCMNNEKVEFTYSKSSCDEANNIQDESTYNCTDYSCVESEEVRITCIDSGTLYCNCTASEGRKIVLSGGTGDMVCSVSNINSGEVCQEFNFDATGDSDIRLKDDFGSLTLNSCTGTDGVEQSCLVDIYFQYEIRNFGSMSFNTTEVKKNYDGVEVSIGPLIGAAFEVGYGLGIGDPEQLDACRLSPAVNEFSVKGVTANGGFCEEIAQLVIPAPGPTPDLVCGNLTPLQREYQLFDKLKVLSTTDSLILDRTTEQYAAFRWIVDSDPMRICPNSEDDEEELVNRYVAFIFYNSMNGDNWTMCNSANATNVAECEPPNNRWLDGSLTCEWFKNECLFSRLKSFGTDENGLRGTIPYEIFSLTWLRNLDLDSNTFVGGTIPDYFGAMTSLESIDLDYNRFSGSIPSSLYEAEKLRIFDVNNNLLNGTISTAVGELEKLYIFQLDDNDFTGTIPSEFGLNTELEFLTLGENKFEGSIPSILGSVTKLRQLTFNDNEMTGKLPIRIGELTELELLRFESNSFNETIPTTYGQLQLLEFLSFSNNILTGQIPSELGLLTNLASLSFHGNMLTGTMPIQICNLKNDGALTVLTVDCEEVSCENCGEGSCICF